MIDLLRHTFARARWKLLGGERGTYERLDYLDAYRTHTDLRAAEDPVEAIGGKWDEIGLLQFDYLRANGMQPSHTLLDIGCGTLRGGRHAIRYLEPGHYTGLELSAVALSAARALLKDEGLEGKRPSLLQNDDLRFRELDGRAFDFILGQSVFTHLPPEHIEECFAHVGSVMHEGPQGSRFFFTYQRRDTFSQVTVKDFGYPFSFFSGLATQHGFSVTELDDYDHPRGQVMVEMRTPGSP